MAITRLRLTVTPASVRNSARHHRSVRLVAGAAADGPADHVVADALAGLAGLILLGLAAAWALRLLGTDRCEFDVAGVAQRPKLAAALSE